MESFLYVFSTCRYLSVVNGLADAQPLGANSREYSGPAPLANLSDALSAESGKEAMKAVSC